MKVITPIAITNSNLTASNVTEDDYPEWDSGTTYDAEDTVIVIGTTHKVYESVQGSNLNNDPTTDDGTWWLEVSATNRWKAFDQKISDQVSNSGTITYSITPSGLVTGVGFLNLSAPEVRVEIYEAASPNDKIYDSTQTLVDTSEIVDWFTYFTTDLSSSFDTEALFIGVPGYAGHQIDITIGDGTGTPLVGQIVIGATTTLGLTQDGTTIGIEDFSTKDRDSFGNAIITERAFADEASFNVAINTADARRVKRVLSNLRATPALYFADEDLISYGMTIYGFFQDFSIPLSSGSLSFATIEIEGLV
jgi:hypothetical protein